MKRTIAIICGGDSSEHDVSLRSGAGIYSFFHEGDYNLYIVDIKKGFKTLKKKPLPVPSVILFPVHIGLEMVHLPGDTVGY